MDKITTIAKKHHIADLYYFPVVLGYFLTLAFYGMRP